jgi:hypothetical protein
MIGKYLAQAPRLKLSRPIDVAEQGKVLDMALMTSYLLLFVTHRNVIRAWDTRTR